MSLNAQVSKQDQKAKFAFFRGKNLSAFAYASRLFGVDLCMQGDQIWRIFAYWAIVYLGKFLF
jgi:hypothetical protein